MPLVVATLFMSPAIGAEHSLSISAIVPPNWNFTSEMISAKTLPLLYSATHGLSAQVETTIQHNGFQPGSANHYLITLRKPVTLSRQDEMKVPMTVEVDGVALSDTPKRIWAETSAAVTGNNTAQSPGERRAIMDVAQHERGPLPDGHYKGELNIMLTPEL